MDVRQLTISGVLENVPLACEFVAAAARDAGLDEKAIYHCHLAVDEACTNIIEHGYGVMGVEGMIDIGCQVEGSRFIIDIRDDSPAFDPTAVPDPERGAVIGDLEPGGLGIYFIKRFMDDVHYERGSGRNHLLLIKMLPAPSADGSAAPNSTLHITLSNLSSKIRCLALVGRLDGMTCRTLGAALSAELSAGSTRLVIDLSGVDYVSSAGIKVLVSAWQRAREQHGDVALAALRPRVREVFEIVGLDLVFALLDTPERALRVLPNR
jgi:serine/threonine-protein kinase RsbW